ncbi:MAG: aminopeptidase P family protein [Chloroflexota bacterium]|nr:aminopeptidase P family protein [Chloroflexota bacterium]
MDDLAARRDEIAGKLQELRARMTQRGLDAALLTTNASTAWLTAGAATYVNESVDEAASALLVTQDEALLLTDPIEEPRLRSEERLDALGFTFVVEPWHARGAEARRRTDGLRVGVETIGSPMHATFDVRGALTAMRSQLTPGEQARLRVGAALAAEAMWEAAQGVAPGMSEHAAAALLAGASRSRGGTATVALVGADERMSAYRHPLPTAKIIQNAVMLVLCFRYQGLVSALTRTVRFGKPTSEQRRADEAVARLDATIIAATQAGRTLGELYETLRTAYAREGAAGQIERHHQGGTIAYLARETLARPGDQTRVAVGQAFAWNPSLPGAKSEDTLILTERGPEIVTTMERWPTLAVPTERGDFARPLPLQRA